MSADLYAYSASTVNVLRLAYVLPTELWAGIHAEEVCPALFHDHKRKRQALGSSLVFSVKLSGLACCCFQIGINRFTSTTCLLPPYSELSHK